MHLAGVRAPSFQAVDRALAQYYEVVVDQESQLLPIAAMKLRAVYHIGLYDDLYKKKVVKKSKLFVSSSHTVLVESMGPGGCGWNILQADGPGLQRGAETRFGATRRARFRCVKRLGRAGSEEVCNI